MAVTWEGSKPGVFINDSVIVPVSAENLNAIVDTVNKICIGGELSGLDAATLQGFGPEAYTTTKDTALEAYYSFDYVSEQLIDSSINENHGTITGLTYESGVSGIAGVFNGTSSYAEGIYPITDTFTLTCWVKTNTALADKRLLTLISSTNAYRLGFFIHNGVAELRYKKSDGNLEKLTALAINDSEWHNLSCTYDGTNLAFYVDGVIVSSAVITLISTTEDIMYICCNENITDFTSASIDEVKMYSREFNPSEIASLYTTKKDVKTIRLSTNAVPNSLTFRTSDGSLEATSLKVTDGSYKLSILGSSSLTADRTLTFNVANANRSLTVDSSGTVVTLDATQTLTNKKISLQDTDYSLSINYTGNGFGIYSSNASSGSGIYSENVSTGYGIYSYNNSTGCGIRAHNVLTGFGIYISNGSTGHGLYISGATGPNYISGTTLTIVGQTLLSSLTASRALYLDASKNITSSSVTSTELGYLSGVTSAIQTQLGTKEPSLGNPAVNGYVLTSTTLGVRSWIQLDPTVEVADITDLGTGWSTLLTTTAPSSWDDLSKLPLAGGTMTGAIVLADVNSSVLIHRNSGGPGSSGITIFNNSIGSGQYIDNTSSGYGLSVCNGSTGRGLDIYNGSDSGYGLYIDNPLTGYGLYISGTTGPNYISGTTLTIVGNVLLSSLTASTYLKLDASKNIATASSIPWTDISSKPTTMSGYGITDGVLTSGNGMATWTATNGNLTIVLGTPSSITNSSTNSVTSTSHTHAISGLTTSNLSATAGIVNAQLANSSVIVNGTEISLGGSGTITANTTNSLILKFDTGATEGTSLYTFNGSASKTIDIKAGAGVTLTKAAGSITISSSGGTGSVTSVAMTVPTGLTISGSPITTSGTLALSFTSGYSIPTTSNQTNWSSAYTFTNGFTTNYPDLVAIEALSATVGYLKKTAANTWSIVNETYSLSTHTHSYLPLAGGTMTGNITFNSVAGRGISFWSSANSYGLWMSEATNGTYGGRISGDSTSDYNMYFRMSPGTNRGFVFESSYATKLFAINPTGLRTTVATFVSTWQDYADSIEILPSTKIEYGKCYAYDHISESYIPSTQHCQIGTIGIASDTYGVCLGVEENNPKLKKLQIAVSGFVLAYLKEKYPIGTALVSGVDGILERATENDKLQYPERIIGTIYKYENELTWGPKNIKVNGRHWVKVK